ncbi:MAG: HNH endonuclease, partial [Anaerolineae bacterium]
MRDYDRKKLWARSGNICSFPGCDTELVPEKRANRVIGEEAHIKGEKPTAPRYDPDQSPEERDSYENRILLCPTHHTEIDADPETWTVERLLEMKAKHEKQIITNRQHPKLMDDLKELMKRYEPAYEFLDFGVPDIIEDPTEVRVVQVGASKEEGV